MCLRNARLLRFIIRKAMHSPFGPSLTPQTTELRRDDNDLHAGLTEYEDGERFARRLRGAFSCADVESRRVLDLGCGYGGRSIFYAQRCGAAEVVGVEVAEAVVARCRALARLVQCNRVDFVVGRAEELPFGDCAFDVVLSFDVLEHVQDPRLAFVEINRVLVYGGHAFLVFPTYLGARSAHLDYLTRVPALHRIFDPATIVTVVNELLVETDSATPPQPEPSVSSLGRMTLPGLNGLRAADLPRLLSAAGLFAREIVYEPLVMADTPFPFAQQLEKIFAAAFRVLGGPELLIGSIGLHLAKGSTSSAPMGTAAMGST
jgi:SAM-dependent methyltransferase